MFLRKTGLLAALAILLTVAPAELLGQYPPGGNRPPGAEGGGPFFPGRPSPGDRGRFRFDPREMFRRMDANRNGVLEPQEIPDRARPFIRRAAERAGLDPSQPIPLDRLFRRIEDRRREEARRGDSRGDRSGSSSPSETGVPGFGVEDPLPKVPGFAVPLDSPLLSTKPLEKRYDARIIQRAERTLRYYDRNGDGVIDQQELKNARWSDDPRNSDLDGDGKLNKVELCERYARRYGNSLARSGRRSSGSSSSTSRSPTGVSGAPRTSSENERIRRYAEVLLRRYDENKNGVLERDEWSKMRSPERYNTNGDSVITLDEIVYGITNFSRSSYRSSASSKTSSGYSSAGARSSGGGQGYKVPTTTERLAELGVPSSFIRDDRNGDGQLQMCEFASNWTDAKVAEFQKYDLNGDWVITPQEWLEAEKKAAPP